MSIETAYNAVTHLSRYLHDGQHGRPYGIDQLVRCRHDGRARLRNLWLHSHPFRLEGHGGVWGRELCATRCQRGFNGGERALDNSNEGLQLCERVVPANSPDVNIFSCTEYGGKGQMRTCLPLSWIACEIWMQAWAAGV